MPAPGAPKPYAAYDLNFETPFRTSPLPATITQSLVDDPNTMLRDALQGLTLTHITRLIVSTENAGGVSNIPFITTNANTQVVESVFAIERVMGRRAPRSCSCSTPRPRCWTSPECRGPM